MRLRVAEVELGLGERHLGERLGVLGAGLVGVLHGADVAIGELPGVVALDLAQIEGRPGGLRARPRALGRRPEGFGVDGEEGIARLHGLPVGEVDLVEVTRHAGLNRHPPLSLEAPGVLLAVDHGVAQRGRRDDLGRRRGVLRRGGAREEEAQDGQGAEGTQ